MPKEKREVRQREDNHVRLISVIDDDGSYCIDIIKLVIRNDLTPSGEIVTRAVPHVIAHVRSSAFITADDVVKCCHAYARQQSIPMLVHDPALVTTRKSM